MNLVENIPDSGGSFTRRTQKTECYSRFSEPLFLFRDASVGR